MKLLLVSDRENEFLWDYYRPGTLDDVDLILACGDMRAEYLEFLVTMGRAPLMYVHGNHDGSYLEHPPEGCECIDGRIVEYRGLRIMGLGGVPVYSNGPFQYTEPQMRARYLRMKPAIHRVGGVDILLTHAAAEGWGSGDDRAHRGFEVFNHILDKYHPACHVHGHVHLNYGRRERILQRGDTAVINAFDKYFLELKKEEADS